VTVIVSENYAYGVSAHSYSEPTQSWRVTVIVSDSKVMVLESNGHGVREWRLQLECALRSEGVQESYGYCVRDSQLWCSRVTVMALESDGHGV
jgi:hypothetical protein